MAADLVIDNYLAMGQSGQPHHVFVSLNEHGRIVLIEGVHRAIINLVAGYTHIPALVLSRDHLWLELIEFFRSQGQSLYKNPQATYHKIKHPDFDSFEVIREDRSQAILAYLQNRPLVKTGLDVGSMIGFYSHALALAGYEMTAIEREKMYASAMQQLGALYGAPCEIIVDDIYKVDVPSGKYAFAVMLSIIYHLLRNDPAACAEYLHDMQAKIPLFFIDTEPRTGILTEDKLRSLFEGFNFERIFAGKDDRDVFAISRPS